MKCKLQAFIILNLVSHMAPAISAEPPKQPTIYRQGPISPQIALTDLSPAEIAANSLYEGVTQIIESKILASSCESATGVYSLNIFANGVPASPESNEVTVTATGDSEMIKLRASLDNPDEFRGQTLSVNQIGTGQINGTQVKDYRSNGSFDKSGNLMVLESSIKVEGVNDVFDLFQSSLIKDFYLDTNPNVYRILDWGLQSVSKLGYPQDKYWQRSMSQRDDGVVGHTVFIKDRLVGSTPCRIVIDSKNSNNRSFFAQSGTITVSSDIPSAPVSAFDSF